MWSSSNFLQPDDILTLRHTPVVSGFRKGKHGWDCPDHKNDILWKSFGRIHISALFQSRSKSPYRQEAWGESSVTWYKHTHTYTGRFSGNKCILLTPSSWGFFIVWPLPCFEWATVSTTLWKSWHGRGCVCAYVCVSVCVHVWLIGKWARAFGLHSAVRN